MSSVIILNWLVQHRKLVIRAFIGSLIAFLMVAGVTLYNKNKKLSQSLEMANNNIEAYHGILNGAQEANNVLKLDIAQLKNSNDKLLQQVDSVRQKLKIKPKVINTVATQTQTIYVTKTKGVRGDTIVNTILKDNIYKDSIQYNDLTKVLYTIGKDTISMTIDIKNQQFLYVYKERHYKNKKSFIKRLFTLDFKKVDSYKYNIVNTNDLLKTSDVRVIENISN